MKLNITLTILLILFMVAVVITCAGKWKRLWELLRDWWWGRGERETLQHQHDSINDTNKELQEQIRTKLIFLDARKTEIKRLTERLGEVGQQPNLNRASTHELLDEIKERIPRHAHGHMRPPEYVDRSPTRILHPELFQSFCELAGLDLNGMMSIVDEVHFKYFCEGHELGLGDRE